MNYVYDGSFPGLLNALEEAIKQNDSTISKQPLLTDNFYIKTDTAKAENFIKKLDKNLAENIYTVFLTEYPEYENILLGYIRYINRSKKYGNIKNSYINKINRIIKLYFNEVNKYKGFIRFTEIEKNLLLSTISPQFNILPYIKDYFFKRQKENFIIYDEKRKIALIKQSNKTAIKEIEITDINISGNEKSVRELWITFFKNISVKNRENFKLQKQHVPLKYRKHIIEFNYLD